ncbi:MAG: hypothetical protein QXP01_06630 [Candidatus Hadarchaeum sp.]
MNKELLSFFVTCQHCHRSFTVPTEIVLKYMDRLTDALGQRLQEKSRRVWRRPATDSGAPANLPVEE